MESNGLGMKMYDPHCGQQAYNSLSRAWSNNFTKAPKPREERLESTTPLAEKDFVTNAPVKDTVLYLAYGSNLSSETFQGTRGIKPLNQVNVHVPELELCFDLPGIPYNEPCFANSRLRKVKPPWANDLVQIQWQKGLVGVVYEVTKADFAKIIATEGGGSSYQDVVVLCFEIPPGTNIIKPFPTTLPFKAHTLLSPSLPPTEPEDPKPSGLVSRPNPDYAQPSARYLRLICDGAEQHNVPLEYRNYLSKLSPYTITSTRQKIGQALFSAIWMPLILVIIVLGKQLADESGRIPAWLAILSNLVFTGLWMSYDGIFKPVFGDGERTEKNDGDEEHMRRDSWDEKKQLLYDV